MTLNNNNNRKELKDSEDKEFQDSESILLSQNCYCHPHVCVSMSVLHCTFIFIYYLSMFSFHSHMSSIYTTISQAR